MAKYTNAQLVQHAQRALSEKWVYWYGTLGQKCTDSLYNSKKKQYPSHYTASREAGYKKDIANNKTCCDCSGLIKSLNTDKTITPPVGATKIPDLSANGFYSAAKVKGAIKTIPEIPGLAVQRDGHIGIYIGGGYVIEAKGFDYDIVKTKLSSGTWTHWLQVNEIDYSGEAIEPQPDYKLGDRALKKGMIGADVKEWQKMLLDMKYKLPLWGDDGDFGSETENVTMEFQKDFGLIENGIVDANSINKAKAVLGETEMPDGPVTDDGKGNYKVVDGASVNIRVGPGTTYATTGVLHSGQRVTVLDTEGWLPVLIDGHINWMSAKYLEKV